jgi:hypothetical protein
MGSAYTPGIGGQNTTPPLQQIEMTCLLYHILGGSEKKKRKILFFVETISLIF